MADDLLRVLTSAPDLASAQDLARSAVAAGLAGNAQVLGPVFAVFRHLGEVGEGSEFQVVLASTVQAYPALERHLLDAHPWQNPEIVALPVTHTPAAYARWLREATGGGAEAGTVDAEPEIEAETEPATAD
ncbi:divalent-cation tolerance protein CutA [Actinospica durhamensis]|uniref:Divalent-cation tolerance protein CutA n=1 Tax=Actinospica durhamensis TaxID=1508375 RepID=A0A941IT71_9ACTN|nr:divalent-cation tolerance protein CutA [Actinospica durhamensis]MBR7837267.1 divalent-cation tolerance protein CutA [Actinospica durhamensis]